MRDARYGLWLAEIEPGHAPIGYAVVAPATLPVTNLAADDLELKRIYLLNRFHGSGVGKRLLEQAVARADTMPRGCCLAFMRAMLRPRLFIVAAGSGRWTHASLK